MIDTTTKISTIDKFDELTGNIHDDTLFIMERQQLSNEIPTRTKYVTQYFNYASLKKDINDYIGIKTIALDLINLERITTRPSADITLTIKENDIYSISAICTNYIGMINLLSTYSLKNVMSDIFKKTNFDIISANNSNWVKNENIVDNISNNDDKNIIQLDVMQTISSNVIDNYSHITSITNDVGDSDNLIASQTLTHTLSNFVSTSYIDNNKLQQSIDTDGKSIANVKLIADISSNINENNLKRENVISSFNKDDGSISAVTQSVINDLRDYILSNYISRNDSELFIKTTNIDNNVGDSSDKVASQLLMKELSVKFDNDLSIPTDISGQFLYCAPNNTLGCKELYQDFAVFLSNETSFLSERITCTMDELSAYPQKYTLFGEGITSDVVYKLTATTDITASTTLSSLYSPYEIPGITNSTTDQFDTTKFNAVEQGTFVYNKLTRRKFYFIDKNFIEF